MKMTCLRFLLAGPFGLALTAVAVGQDAPLVPVSFRGTEAFGHFLHSFDLQPARNTADLAKLAPEKTLVVIFGDLAKLGDGLSAARLEVFLKQGGALLLASDYPDGQRLPFGLTNSGQVVRAAGPSAYQRKWDECPLAQPANRLHPLFKNLSKGLATNRPSFLVGHAPELRCLAGFGKDCLLIHADPVQLTGVPDGAGYMFGSPADAGPAGRVLILAGPGVFLNGMLFQTDNDNFAFTWNTVQWLSAGPRGRREYALFIDDGKVVDRFALPLSKFGPVPMPRIEIINQLLRGLEDENFFNKTLMQRIDKDEILRKLAWLASALVLFLGARRMMHSRFRLDTAVPLVVGKLDAAPPAMPVQWQRSEELRRLKNFWEPAQVLARQFFLDHAGMTVPLWDDAAAAPAVEAEGGFWRRRTLARQVDKLWHLALSSPAQPVDQKEFDNLLRTLAELSEAVTAGRLRLAAPAKT
jgi:hypothetical protein